MAQFLLFKTPNSYSRQVGTRPCRSGDVSFLFVIIPTSSSGSLSSISFIVLLYNLFLPRIFGQVEMHVRVCSTFSNFYQTCRTSCHRYPPCIRNLRKSTFSSSLRVLAFISIVFPFTSFLSSSIASPCIFVSPVSISIPITFLLFPISCPVLAHALPHFPMLSDSVFSETVV